MGSRHGRKALLVRGFGIRCSGPSSAVFSDWNALPSALICPDHSAEFPEGKYQWKSQYRGDARQTGTDRVDQDVTSCPDGKVGERLLPIQLSPAAPSESGLGVGSGADPDVGRAPLSTKPQSQPTQHL